MADRRDQSAAETVFLDSHPAWLPPVDSIEELSTDASQLFEGARCFVDNEDQAYIYTKGEWKVREA